MEIRITEADPQVRKPRPQEMSLGFGKYTSDHMFLMDYTQDQGWHNARIEPYQPLRLDPAAMVLHYNQEVFEGLKAYHLADGGIGLFRPGRNMERLNASARRMVMPEIDPDLGLRAMQALVRVDRAWIPTSPGTSLYIRPTMIANEAALGVRAATQYLFYIIAGPVGAYYAGGFNPTRIYVSDEHVRAVRGGAGFAKTSCNYGPTLLVQQQALAKGYAQVLWLDAVAHRFVEEVGTSNIFFYIQEELITPPLEGTILAGVTRDSVLKLAQHWGIRTTQRPITIDEVIEACRSGALTETFATGTAAVVSPVGAIGFKGRDYQVADGRAGVLAQKLYDAITGIQYGRADDPFGWLVRVT